MSCLPPALGDRQRRRAAGTVAVAMRMLVGAGGKHRDLAVLLDTHGEFGADQIEAFGAHMAAEQAHARDADFRFRRARHHGAVGIAHDDVADADGGAAVLGALDLGAADFDALAAAEILRDGGSQPRGEGIKLDRAARKPPPQAAEAEQSSRPTTCRRRSPTRRDQPPMPGQDPPIGSQIPAIARTLAAVSRRKAAPASWMDERLPSGDGRALPILVRHARSGVPSSVAPSSDIADR